MEYLGFLNAVDAGIAGQRIAGQRMLPLTLDGIEAAIAELLRQT